MIKGLLSSTLQILFFAIFIGLYDIWTGYKKGKLYSPKIINGASLSRDENGFLNIEAETIEDGFFALGFAHAEERLWQMYIGYKLAAGETSEIFGELGLDFDKFTRMLNFKTICKNTLERFTYDEMKRLQAYTDGVNFYIKKCKVLPIEFILLKQPKFEWKNEYSCLSIKLVEYYLSSDFLMEVIREYLVNKGLVSMDLIEKILPYSYENFISRKTIIKDYENLNLRKKNVKNDKKDNERKKTQKTENTEKNIKNTEKKSEKKLENKEKKLENTTKTEKIEKKLQNTTKTENTEKKIENTNKTENTKKKLENNTKTENIEKKLENTTKTEKIEKKSENPEKKSKKKDIKNDESKSKLPQNQTTSSESQNKKKEKIKINPSSTRHDLHAGSNNYVFSGNITKDGSAIIGNDPHLHNSMPGFWYFANIKIKNSSYHFTGATHPGSPLFFIGQNGYLGWGITIGFSDIADFVKLNRSIINKELKFKLDDDNIDHELTVRLEKFYLSRDYNIDNFVLETYFDSEIGPVVNGFEDSLFILSGIDKIKDVLTDCNRYFYILKSSFTNKYDNNFHDMMKFDLGKDIKSIIPLISDISICLNLVYADTKGNIGYHLTGKIPIRKYKKDGSYPKILKKESDLISEYIPFDELPNLENPERGYIVTCNNLIISDDYKYILQGQFFGDHRFRSIENNIISHLNSGKKIDTQFVIDKIINNVHDVVCDDILKYIKEINLKDNYTSKFMEKFSSFNCEMESESKDALIYNTFIVELLNSLPYITKEKLNDKTIEYDIPLLNEIKRIPSDTDERANFLYYFMEKFKNDKLICQRELNQSCSEFLDSIYNKAIKFLTKTLGRDREKYWKWKNLNYKIYQHTPFSNIPFLDILSSKRIKTNGNIFTPKIAGYHASDRKYESILSSNLKFVSNLNNPNEYFVSIDCGNSGRIFNEFYDNLCTSHEEGKLINFHYQKSYKPTLKFFHK